jgi:hypothetical protein
MSVQWVDCPNRGVAGSSMPATPGGGAPLPPAGVARHRPGAQGAVITGAYRPEEPDCGAGYPLL